VLVGGERKLDDEIDSRLTAADVEFVDRCQIVKAQAVRVLAGRPHGVEDGAFERAVCIVLRDLLFGGHTVPLRAGKLATPARRPCSV